MASEGLKPNSSDLSLDSAAASDALLEKLSNDYAGFLLVEADKERQLFNDAVEDILIRLEDFLGTSDMVRSDLKLSLNATLNQIHIKSKEIEKHFERIDRLEAFVAMVKSNVSALEAAVDKAESDVGALGSIKKALNSFSIPFLSNKSKSPPPATIEAPKFEPVVIYRTEDFFGSAPSTHTNTNSNSSGSTIESYSHQAAAVDGASNHEHLIIADVHRVNQNGCLAKSECDSPADSEMLTAAPESFNTLSEDSTSIRTSSETSLPTNPHTPEESRTEQ